MARTQRVRATDIMRCMNILGECLETGADRDGWPVHLFESLRGLLDAEVVIGGEMLGLGRGQPTDSVSLYRVGWSTPSAAQKWRDYAQAGPDERKPEFPVLCRVFEEGGGRGVTMTRDEIWGGPEVWSRSKTFNEVHRQCGIDDYVFSIRRLPNAGTVSTMWVHRPVGSRAFGARDRRLLSFLHDRVMPMVGRALASGTEPGIADLPPRPRQVLDLVLRGQSEQEIAARLGLSKPTVHEHATRVYRHYGVSSRAELLSWFIGRHAPPPAI